MNKAVFSQIFRLCTTATIGVAERLAGQIKDTKAAIAAPESPVVKRKSPYQETLELEELKPRIVEAEPHKVVLEKRPCDSRATMRSLRS